jgi:hypothetical protein
VCVCVCVCVEISIYLSIYLSIYTVTTGSRWRAQQQPNRGCLHRRESRACGERALTTLARCCSDRRISRQLRWQSAATRIWFCKRTCHRRGQLAAVAHRAADPIFTPCHHVTYFINRGPERKRRSTGSAADRTLRIARPEITGADEPRRAAACRVRALLAFSANPCVVRSCAQVPSMMRPVRLDAHQRKLRETPRYLRSLAHARFSTNSSAFCRFVARTEVDSSDDNWLWVRFSRAWLVRSSCCTPRQARRIGATMRPVP